MQSRTSSPREQKFRANRRNASLKYYGKILMFALPIMAILAVLVIVPFWRVKEVNLLYVDWGTKIPNTKFDHVSTSMDSIHVSTIRLSSMDSIYAMKKQIEFKGYEQDLLIAFVPILGTTRASTDGEKAVIFCPTDQQAYETHQFTGLLRTQTEDEKAAWRSAKQFLSDFAKPLGKAAKEQGVADPKVILALDVFHPDIAGGHAPQADRFVANFEKIWGKVSKEILDEHGIQLFVWISHHSGENNYLAADPDHLGSFFKRRFELGILGDADEDQNNHLTYLEFRDYVKEKVTNDASLLMFRQSPVFLEPKTVGDFNISRLRNSPLAELAKIFDYRKRESNDELDTLWGRYERKRDVYKWKLENPLHLQQSQMLLVQMERLWYAGLANTELYHLHLRRINSILDSKNSIPPVIHTLREKEQASFETEQEQASSTAGAFQLGWLDPPETSNTETESGEQADTENPEFKRWKSSNPDWRRSLGVWDALVTMDPNNYSSPAEFNALVGHICEFLALDSAETFSDLRHVSSIVPSNGDPKDLPPLPWNELVYLHRLKHEMYWPAKDQINELVLQSIKARDTSNRIAAELSPTLVEFCSEDFQKLEEHRRKLEDHLFSCFDENLLELLSDFRSLNEELADYRNEVNELRERIERLNHEIALSPFYLRYCAESAATEGKLADSTIFVKQWAKMGPSGFNKVEGREKWSDSLDEEAQSFEELKKDFLVSTTEDYSLDPATDFEAWSKSESHDFRIAEINTRGRRLITWPDLDLQKRKEIRRGLAEKVKPNDSESAPLRSESQSEADTRFAQYHEMSPMFRPPLIAGNDTWESKERLEKNQLSLYNDLVHHTHQLLILEQDQNDAAFVEVGTEINFWRSQYSRLVFERIANDLWGTSVKFSVNQKYNIEPYEKYCVAALESHDSIVKQRLKSLTFPNFQKPWQDLDLKELDRNRKFAGNFNKWSLTNGAATNEGLTSGINHPDRLGVRVGETDLSGKLVTNENVRHTREAIVGNQVNIPGQFRVLDMYLRGHYFQVEIDESPGENVNTEVVQLDFSTADSNPYKTLLTINQSREINARIAFIVDCSYSNWKKERNGKLNGKKFDGMKEEIQQFLQEVSHRGDTQVSLYAIGAVKAPARDDRLITGESTGWSFVFDGEHKHDNDVVEYTGDDLSAALKSLKPHGQTPILQGLHHVLGQEEVNLVVLITDGYEFTTNDDRSKIQGWNQTLYEEIGGRLAQEEGKELVVFKTSSKPYNDQSIKDFNPPQEVSGLRGIRERIRRIDALVEKRLRHNPDLGHESPLKPAAPGASDRDPEKDQQEALRLFLANLLPNPNCAVTDDSTQPRERIKKSGPLEEGPISVSRDVQPESWSVAINYDNATGASRTFSKEGAEWNSQTRMAGNEELKFTFDPFAPSLRLLTEEPKEEEFESFSLQDLPVRMVPFNGQVNKRVTNPKYRLWSQQDDKLTPAPELAFVTIKNKGEPKSPVLVIQDFRLPRQQNSNVHVLEFSPNRESLRSALGLNEIADLQLMVHMSYKTNAGFWHSIDLIQAEVGSLETDIKSVPQKKPFSNFRFQGKRVDNDESQTFTISVSSVDGKEDLDQWLIQPIDAVTNRVVKKGLFAVRRKYEFRGERLAKINHEFEIHNSATKNLRFGLARMDLDERIRSADTPQIQEVDPIKSLRIISD